MLELYEFAVIILALLRTFVGHTHALHTRSPIRNYIARCSIYRLRTASVIYWISHGRPVTEPPYALPSNVLLKTAPAGAHRLGSTPFHCAQAFQLKGVAPLVEARAATVVAGSLKSRKA